MGIREFDTINHYPRAVNRFCWILKYNNLPKFLNKMSFMI